MNCADFFMLSRYKKLQPVKVFITLLLQLKRISDMAMDNVISLNAV